MKILVTGGGGFLGGAIIDRLLQRGDDLRSLARGDYPELKKRGVDTIRGDIANADVVDAAVAGCDCVHHVAALAALVGAREEFEAVNITGTSNIIEACRKHRVDRLVFTSSPSVTFAGVDQEGEDEAAPYAQRYLADYPRTKADAERLVIAANDDTLATVALRPHLIWGPGDRHLLPRLMERVRKGRMRFVGPATNRVDSVYIDNAADAQLLAQDLLRPGAAVAGQVYTITNGEPLPIAEFINRMLAAGGLPAVRRSISPTVAYGVGAVLETIYRVFGLRGEPAMTRFLARQLSTAHWFHIGAARRDLGYEPKVTIDEGMRRLQVWLAQKNNGGAS